MSPIVRHGDIVAPLPSSALPTLDQAGGNPLVYRLALNNFSLTGYRVTLRVLTKDGEAIGGRT